MKNRCIRVEDEVWDQWRDLAEAKGVSVVDVLRSAMDKEVGFTCPECGGSGVVTKPHVVQSKPQQKKQDQPVTAHIPHKPDKVVAVIHEKPVPVEQKVEQPVADPKPEKQCYKCKCLLTPKIEEFFGGQWFCKSCLGQKLPETEIRGKKEHAA